MTATLSQLELSLWKGFKRQQAHHYESEFDCFYVFAQERLEYWLDLPDESRVMAVQQATISAAPAAKLAGDNGGIGHKPCRDDRRDGCVNRQPWNQPSSSNDPSNFQAHSAAAQSQAESNSNANNRYWWSSGRHPL